MTTAESGPRGESSAADVVAAMKSSRRLGWATRAKAELNSLES